MLLGKHTKAGSPVHLGTEKQGTRREQSQRGVALDPSELSHTHKCGVYSGSGNPVPKPHLQTKNTPDSIAPRRVLTIRPAHGIIQHAGDTSPQGALGRVARVHAAMCGHHSASTAGP